MGPEGHRFVILDNISFHSIAGSIGINENGFIVIRISKEAISFHKCFHAFKGMVHVGSPMKDFLSRLAGERCKNMCIWGPYVLVVVDSTKETVHM